MTAFVPWHVFSHISLEMGRDDTVERCGWPQFFYSEVTKTVQLGISNADMIRWIDGDE